MELPVEFNEHGSKDDSGKDFSKLYQRLQGPNLKPNEDELPGLRKALEKSVVSASLT